MLKIAMAVLIIICSIVIVVSFFMPWAKAVTTSTKVASGLTDIVARNFAGTSLGDKIVSKMTQATEAVREFGDVQFKTTVSGYEIPVLVNRKDSTTALSFVQAFIPQAEGTGKRLLLIYLIPLMALLCIALVVLGMKNSIYIFLITIISGVVAIGGIYKAATANLANTMVKITLEHGLWQSLYGYLAIFIFSILWLMGNKARR